MSDTDPFSEIPEELVKSVLERSGFQDTAAELGGAPTPAEPPSPSDALPVAGEAEEEEPPVDIPVAPGGPLFREEEPGDEEESEPPPPDVITLSDGRKYPLALVEEWANRANAPVPAAPAPTDLQPGTPALPPLNLPVVTEEDLEMAGPAVKALLMIVNAQAQQQKRLQEEFTNTRQVIESRSRRENAEVANSAASAFQREFNLPDDLMNRIRETTSPADVQMFLERNPDPYKAVEYALTRSFWNLPEARQYEFERQQTARSQAQARKQKLAGVSGSSGSGPRNQPVIEDTPEGRYNAAVEEVKQAMFGDS